ncbi:hypothetical protein OF83DRAFT_127682 [Amylostereum chailletii]|nr:hypothetical protein OF83DRAFT_127682 [Amylostereum chailletii]
MSSRLALGYLGYLACSICCFSSCYNGLGLLSSACLVSALYTFARRPSLAHLVLRTELVSPRLRLPYLFGQSRADCVTVSCLCSSIGPFINKQLRRSAIPSTLCSSFYLLASTAKMRNWLFSGLAYACIPAPRWNFRAEVFLANLVRSLHLRAFIFYSIFGHQPFLDGQVFAEYAQRSLNSCTFFAFCPPP